MLSTFRSAVLAVLVSFFIPVVGQAAIHSETIDYEIDGQVYQGYLSYDDSISGKRPGVLVVHEWWGHNAYARKRAEMLASLGYTAFALDMYGKGKVTEHPDQAKQFMQAALADMSAAENRFKNALDILRNHPTVNPANVAGIGYCFGGGTVLHMARAGFDLAGVVSFHGSLATDTPAQPGKVKAKIMVFNGAADPFVPAEAVNTFKQEMENANADYAFIDYPGVMHSFTSKDADKLGKLHNLPLLYDAHADKDSWQKMQVFFNSIFE